MPSPLTPAARRELLEASAAASALAGLGLPVDVLAAQGERWLERTGGRSGAGLRPRAASLRRADAEDTIAGEERRGLDSRAPELAPVAR